MDAVTVTGQVIMTADEARACVNRIKTHCEGITTELADLHDREGWKALGYSTWRECIYQEFNLSKQRAHQLLNLHTVTQILTAPAEPKVNKLLTSAGGRRYTQPTPDTLREAHARELAPLIDQPETLRAVHADVTEKAGGKPTASAYKEAVERVKPKAARSISPTRYADPDIPPDPGDDVVMGYSNEPADLDADHAVDDDINQERYKSGPPTTLCGICGERFTGALCPCSGHGATTAVSEPAREDPYEAMDPFDGLTPHPDGESPPVSADDLVELSDRPGAAVETGSDASTAEHAGVCEPASDPAPPAPSPEASRNANPGSRTTGVSEGAGKKHTVPATRVFASPSLDAGDVARTLLDLDGAVKAIWENATPEQRKQLRAAGGEPTPATRVDLKLALGQDRTVLEIAEALAEAVTENGRVSLLAVMADALPAERLAPLAHRLAVRTKGAGSEPATGAVVTLKSVKADIRRLTVAEIRSLEFELPQIRKEVGARERAAV